MQGEKTKGIRELKFEMAMMSAIMKIKSAKILLLSVCGGVQIQSNLVYNITSIFCQSSSVQPFIFILLPVTSATNITTGYLYENDLSTLLVQSNNQRHHYHPR